jgi:hypothetical protein
MMDPSNISRAAELYQEMGFLKRAVEFIDANGTITAVTLTTSSEGEPDRNITIPTEGLQYPPQMVAAIKAQLEERENAINHELEELGVAPMQVR